MEPLSPREGGRGGIHGAYSRHRIGRVERREAIGVVRSGLFHGREETAEMARNDKPVRISDLRPPLLPKEVFL